MKLKKKLFLEYSDLVDRLACYSNEIKYLRMISELCPTPDVLVSFANSQPIEQVINEIKLFSNPQIILWYIGCNGLRNEGAQFYKNSLIVPILMQKPEATFWLVDLTAWGAFKDSFGSINKSSSCCDAIEQFTDPRIKCIRSSVIFKRMQDLSDPELIDYFRIALRKNFLHKPSEKFSNKNILVKDIFSDRCPVMEDWMTQDVSKAYSVFQYLEGCFLIEEIVTQMKGCQITFALPNDEIKYYRDELDSFQKDVSFFLSRRCLENIEVQIKFLAFQYGNELQHRPYNMPGHKLKPKQLSYLDVAGNL